MKILVVEDAEILRKSLETGLTDTGYQVESAADGKEGLRLATDYHFDLILLDVMLPGIDGFTILKYLRQSGSDVLILMLTARDAIDDRVHGLTHGADDYLVKPFHFAELQARIETLFRRRFGTRQKQITVGHITLNLLTKTATSSAGEPLALPPREYALLEYLMLHRDRVISRTEIEEHIYGDFADPMSNVVSSAISTLRRAVDQVGSPSLIKTRRGLGYQLCE